jgi:hypothetical protein
MLSTCVSRLMPMTATVALSFTLWKSDPHLAQRGYPPLLWGVPVTGAQQVWCTDIMDIRRPSGLLTLIGVMAWCSHYVLSCTVSITYGRGLWSRVPDQASKVVR